MSNLTSKRKEARMKRDTNAKIISDRSYNLALGGTVFYGLLINVIMCACLGDVVSNMNPIIFLIGYFACALTGIFMSTKSDNPIISFIGYNLVVLPVGLVVSSVVSSYVASGMGYLVTQAMLITTIVTFVMIVLSLIFPNFFSKLGIYLFFALLGLLIVQIIAIFVVGRVPILFAWIGATIFSLYIGYDYWKAQSFPKTLDNAIDSALDLYLDIINLFLDILRILGSSKSSRD